MMDKIFLDANVLFSAAYNAKNGLLKFWKLPDIFLISSHYAIEEARRNLSTEEQLERLKELIENVTLVPEVVDTFIPSGVVLPIKDRPILAAAIYTNCSFLITGDFKDFGKYFNTTIQGVKILPPAAYFALFT